MTDKELIKQEIERLKHTSNAYDRSRFMLLLEIEKFIDSLPEEPAIEDLERTADGFYNNCNIPKSSWWDEGVLHKMSESKETFIAGAEWQNNQMKETLQTEYEKGRYDTRKEMMKDAVETTIVNDWQYGKDPDHVVIPAIHQRIEGFGVGDRVKIIIIKEE